MGVRITMKTINELRKSAIDKHPDVIAARKAHKAGNWDGNVDKDGEAIVYIKGKPHTVTNNN